MPTSKPFSASSCADSCPIPESDAVTRAPGLIPPPLFREIYPPDSMPLEWSAKTEYSRYEPKSSATASMRRRATGRGACRRVGATGRPVALGQDHLAAREARCITPISIDESKGDTHRKVNGTVVSALVVDRLC